MRQALRAVSWAITTLWIVLLVFTITAVYSAFQIRIGFAETKTNVSGGTAILFMPFYIKNGGLYDISNLNLTTLIKSDQGVSVSDSSTLLPSISGGANVTATHNISLSLSGMLSKGLPNMLFNDSTLNVDVTLKVEYARVVPLQISSNFSMPWGAPLYNLTLGKPSVNGTNVTVPLSFENHSFFALNGTITLELFNDSDQPIGTGTATLNNVQPQTHYSTLAL